MAIFQRILHQLRGAKRAEASPDAEALRIDFRARYQAFKRLLAANRKTLNIMADMEQALSGDRPFGMPFVRASCTAASVNVLKMINCLDQLSHGKYPELKERFAEIQAKIEHLLIRDRMPENQQLVIDIKALNRHLAGTVGYKMANLGEIGSDLDLSTPAGFVITAAAYEQFIQENDLQDEINRRCQAADLEKMDHLHVLSSGLQQLITRARVPDEVRRAATLAWEQMAGERSAPLRMAMRSSALGEDAAGASFAGQYRSILNVGMENFLEDYKEVLASKYAIQAMVYRLNRGIRDEDVAMCVGCLEMVPAVSGGVMYTRSPLDSGDDSIFINAAWGLPKLVVEGSSACDLVVVSRKRPLSIVRSDTGVKEQKFVCFPEEGVCRVTLTDEQKEQPSISHAQALALAEIALKIETYYQASQDIEWAIASDGTIYVLQCRPLQSAAAVGENASPEGPSAEDGVIFKGEGVTASGGAASGNIFQVHKNIDMLRFPQGAVLVTRQALPVWASLLNRAAAVVTEQGSFAGHLANVAREFGVPALFGVTGAVEKLAEGQCVTVDADRRAVFNSAVTSLPARPAAPAPLMSGSPIYNTLQQISRSVVPLNLLEPDAPNFTPGNCRTLHDLTRFIHEKAVQEMFTFGKIHTFPERSSKQLYCNVPMQWWVLNLDDGFLKEVNGNYVRLENICSLPMRAFWEGYIAVPWEGPPPVDGRGMLAVMFRSTMNPALSPGVRSWYADRNYFMISKNYCSLSSRLGYHFSTLEALISDRVAENYLSFQFKGGAADYDRRHKRVSLIGSILEETGFWVEIRKDNLVARIQAHDLGYMTARIKVLGYLTLHTRQLDMIMANKSAVQHYRTKMKKDISHLICIASGREILPQRA